MRKLAKTLHGILSSFDHSGKEHLKVWEQIQTKRRDCFLFYFVPMHSIIGMTIFISSLNLTFTVLYFTLKFSNTSKSDHSATQKYWRPKDDDWLLLSVVIPMSKVKFTFLDLGETLELAKFACYKKKILHLKVLRCQFWWFKTKQKLLGCFETKILRWKWKDKHLVNWAAVMVMPGDQTTS